MRKEEKGGEGGVGRYDFLKQEPNTENVGNKIAGVMEVIAALELTLGEGWCGHLKELDSWAKQATEALDAEVTKVVTLLGLELAH